MRCPRTSASRGCDEAARGGLSGLESLAGERAQRGQAPVWVQRARVLVGVGLAGDAQELARAGGRGVKEEGAEHVGVELGVARAARLRGRGGLVALLACRFLLRRPVRRVQPGGDLLVVLGRRRDVAYPELQLAGAEPAPGVL